MVGSTRLSRRSVLTWGGVLGVTLLVPVSAGSATAAPPGRRPVPEVPGRARLLTPSGQDDRDVPRSLGIVLDDPLPSGTQVEFTYDPDLYERLPGPLALSGDAPVPVTWHAPQPGHVVVTLGAATTAATTVVVGALRPARYPHDIRRDARHTVVGGQVARTGLDARRSGDAAATPWGAECGVLWDAVDWDGRYRYFVPLSASFVAVGPGPVPSGAELHVRADARVLAGLTVVRAVDASGRAVRGTSRTQLRHAVTTLTWRCRDEVPPGERVVLELRPSLNTLRGALTGVSLPVVDFVAPTEASGSQRESRLTSLARRDVVCDDAAVEALRPA